jgi:hypothetical protein
MIKPELLVHYSEPTPKPIFMTGRIPSPEICESLGSTARVRIDNMRECWEEAQESLAQITQVTNPSGTAIRQLLDIAPFPITLPLREVGNLIGENGSDRLRQIRAALQVGKAVGREKSGQWQFAQEELEKYIIGIMANRLYGQALRKEASLKTKAETTIA